MANREQRSIDLDGTGQSRKQKDSRFYIAKVRCTNCGHAGECKMPKGLHVEGYPCPHCHCLKLVPDPHKKEKS